MITKLFTAPLKHKLLNESGTLDKVWLQFFGDLTTSLKGSWGTQSLTTALTPETNTMLVQGNQVSVYLKFNGLSTGDTVEIKNISVYDDVIKMSQINGGNVVSITDLYVENNEFTIPAISTSDTVIISGNLIRRIS